jgi:hypothetical protein
VHLVGIIIIRIYHDVRPSERQTLSSMRLTASMLYEIQFSFNHLIYSMLPKSFYFIKNKLLQCLSCFVRLFDIFITGTSLVLRPKLAFYIANEL